MGMQKNSVNIIICPIIEKYWAGIIPSNRKKKESHTEKAIKKTSVESKIIVGSKGKWLIVFLKYNGRFIIYDLKNSLTFSIT